MMRARVNQIYNNPDGKGAGMRTRSRPKASGRQLRSVERSGQWAPASLRPLVPRYWYETQILNLATTQSYRQADCSIPREAPRWLCLC